MPDSHFFIRLSGPRSETVTSGPRARLINSLDIQEEATEEQKGNDEGRAH